MSAHSNTATDADFMGSNRAGLLRNAGMGLLVLGLALSGAGFASNADRFAEGYLAGFEYVLTLCLGALFFVLIQHLTKAGWSVGPRRQAEWIASFLPFMAIFFIPIAVKAPHLFGHWWHTEHHDELLAKKAAYLNPQFFYIRAATYFVVWFLVSRFFAGTSRKQDESGDPALTVKMQVMSAPSMVLFGLTLTFAGFDWIMSLDPHWYSTIFGVYVFAGGLVSALATLALFQIGLQKSGVLGKVGTVEHRHDLGKLLFGFTVFWAYIGFSQFFLIWYANIPEETIFFVRRWFDADGGHSTWMPVSMALLSLHFWVPFFVLLSRHVKRSYLGLALGAGLLLVAHYIDMYWMIMPSFVAGEDKIVPAFAYSWMDLGGLLAPLGGLVTWIGIRAAKDPVYPLKDPRLPEAVAVVNL